MGKEYLWLALVVSWAHTARATPIELEPMPVPVAPPPLEEKDPLGSFLQRQRQERQKSTQANQGLSAPPGSSQAVPGAAATERDQQLDTESRKERPLNLFFQVSLVYPRLTTSGPRRNYTTEPTTHFHMYFRPFDSEIGNGMKLWSGFRMATFGGTGIYQTTPGRYGFTYLGPIIGMGRIAPAEKKKREEAETLEQTVAEASFPVREGWLVSGGISWQSREAEVDQSNDYPAEDFNVNRGAQIDGLGLWGEITWIKIHFGALGTHYVAGFQQGKGKNFLWVGVALAGWY